MVGSRLFSVLSKKIIKPSTPTPLSLRRYNLSGIDQAMHHFYMPIAALFPKGCKAPAEMSNILQSSLSRILASYYPFAGRLRNNVFVECNDMGARFWNVQLNCSMSEALRHPDTGPEFLPFPRKVWARTSDEDSLVVAQLSHFNCGGTALSACISHKVADGCTAFNFLQDWAALAQDPDTNSCPLSLTQNIGASIFPPSKDAPPNLYSAADDEDDQEIKRLSCIVKRYIFSNHKLEILRKEIMTTQSGAVLERQPTRVEIVTALIYKCAMVASSRANKSFKASILNETVNLRPRIVPPLPQSAVGNIMCLTTITTNKEDEMELSRLIQELRKAKERVQTTDHAKQNEQLGSALSNHKEHNEEANSSANSNDFDMYWVSSLCNFPLRNLDFGWGRPTRVVVPPSINNLFFFMDNPSGDGIEVVISLDQQVMSEFENSQELLEFASPAP